MHRRFTGNFKQVDNDSSSGSEGPGLLASEEATIGVMRRLKVLSVLPCNLLSPFKRLLYSLGYSVCQAIQSKLR